jgi:hypothetical protein
MMPRDSSFFYERRSNADATNRSFFSGQQFTVANKHSGELIARQDQTSAIVLHSCTGARPTLPLAARAQQFARRGD